MIKMAMHRLSNKGVHEKIGYVYLSDSPGGLLLEAELEGLPPGDHGFHVHEYGDIEPGKNKKGKVIAGGAAGQHLDPAKTEKHLGPYRNGHLGDLPYIIAEDDGTCDDAVLAPRLMLEDVEGLALIIHECGDNYSDYPLPNGGGKSRIAGGIISNDCPYCKKERNRNLMILGTVAAGVYAFKKL